MIVTTTTLIEGRPVQQYLGVVTGEVIAGANLVRDMLFASITDIFGGRSGKYEEVRHRARAGSGRNAGQGPRAGCQCGDRRGHRR